MKRRVARCRRLRAMHVFSIYREPSPYNCIPNNRTRFLITSTPGRNRERGVMEVLSPSLNYHHPFLSLCFCPYPLSISHPASILPHALPSSLHHPLSPEIQLISTTWALLSPALLFKLHHLVSKMPLCETTKTATKSSGYVNASYIISNFDELRQL